MFVTEVSQAGLIWPSDLVQDAHQLRQPQPLVLTPCTYAKDLACMYVYMRSDFIVLCDSVYVIGCIYCVAVWVGWADWLDSRQVGMRISVMAGCMSGGLLAGKTRCLPAWLHARSLSVWLPVCLPACLLACLPSCLHVYMMYACCI